MNLIFRMIWIVIAAHFREKLPLGKTRSSLTLRVMPNDLDLNFHMNNGRYLTICDLGRMDLFVRTGLLKSMLRRKWMPVIAEHTMAYKKPLGLFERFDTSVEVTHWDDKYFYMKHIFSNPQRVIAEGTSKGALYMRGTGVVKPEDVIAAVEEDGRK